jgi:ubiquinone/menaquinone biosynthesis C-methylase UbiE
MAQAALEVAPLGNDTGTPLSLRRRVDLIESLVSLADADLLDCGCGEGSYVVELGQRAARARGVEYQAEKVARFQHDHPGDERVAQGDVERLTFADSSFDVVLMNETIEHFPDDRAALRSAHRVLRAHGTLMVLAPNRWYPFESHGVYSRRTGRLLSPAIPGIPYLPARAVHRLFRPWARNYWPRELRARIEAAGFDVVQTGFLWQTFEGISGQQPQLVRFLAPVLRKLGWCAERTPGVRRFGVTQWVVARKGAES